MYTNDTIKFLNGKTFKNTDEARYLGCKLNYESNIRAELAKRKATCNHIWRKLENFWKHSNTPARTKLHVYDAVI